MATEVEDPVFGAGNTRVSETDDQGFSQLPKAALLLVIGEPLSEDHKTLILAEITKGFKTWDPVATEIDINEELAQIANRASLGEEGPNGERVVRHRSENIAVEILVNPQAQTVRRCLKGFLKVPSQLKFLLYAGHAFQGSGAWVLQDDVFTFANFIHIFKDTDVENALKQQEQVNLTFYSLADGDWSSSINKQDISKILKIKVNPPEKLDNVHGVLQFTAYVSSFVKTQSLSSLLSTSDIVGNIKFNNPTLYIFPGCQGDSALFGIDGFSLLVNGGYNRKACFWGFTRHLDKIDAVLLTHLGTDNLFGLGSVLQRKSSENVCPEIGFMYLNSSEKTRSSPAASTENLKEKDCSLLINLAEEGNRIIEYSKKLGHFPHPVSRSMTGNQQEPVNLYHKVGHGSLDMFVLNPVHDSKELKEFYQQWNKQVSNFGANQHFPLPNMLSICALVVWRPANPKEKITRIFFPGNAPQHKIIEGLEKIKHLDFLKHPSCCLADLTPPAKKIATRSGTRPTPRSNDVKFESPRKATPVKSETPKKADVLKTERSRPMSNTLSKGNKVAKEDTNRKASKTRDMKKKDDQEKEKADKAKSSTSSSPSKSSVKSASSTKSPSSPTKTLKESVAKTSSGSENEQPSVSSLMDTSLPTESLMNHMNGNDGTFDTQPLADETPIMMPVTQDPLQTEVRQSASPAPLPDPVEYEPETVSSLSDTPALEPQPPYDKQKLAELGIYDDDDDEETEDVNGCIQTEPAYESSGTTQEEPEEIEQPQSLPEPVEVHEQSPMVPEPDLIQETVPMKETPPEIEDQTSAAAEPDIVPNTNDTEKDVDDIAETTVQAVKDDPAEEIPSSPEPTEGENFSFSNVVDDRGESTPQFSHEPDVVACMQGQQPPIEQSIQYGITDDNGRHMGGIREEEEEEDGESARDSQEKQMVEDLSREESARDSQEKQIMEDISGEESPRDSQEKQMMEDISREDSLEPGRDTSLEPVESSPEPVEQEEENEETSNISQVNEVGENTKFDKLTMEEMGIYDEDEEEEEGIEGGPNEEQEPDAYVYEKDVDLGDEEGPQHTRESSEEPDLGFGKENQPPVMGTPLDERYADYDQHLGSRESESPEKDTDEAEKLEVGGDQEEYQRDSIEREQECSIPEAFEKDETPTPGESIATDSALASEIQNEGSIQRDDTDSIDGGTPDDDKDIDESFTRECDLEDATVVNGSQETDLMAGGEPCANMKEVAQNPFDCTDQGAQNPFMGIAGSNVPQVETSTLNPFSEPFEPESKKQSEGFDPVSEWGQPMGLPSPPPPEDSKSGSQTKSAKTAKNGAKASDVKKTLEKRPTSASSKAGSKPANGLSKPSDSKAPKTARSVATVEKKADPKKPTVPVTNSKAPTRTRPATAPVKSENAKSARPASARRPGTATSRSSPPAQRGPPLPPVTPFYVDLTYIPNHGDPGYSDVEFFKRVRARNYVLSAISPNPHILNALLEAKKVWEDKDLEVTVIPTYDNETLRHWMGLHKEDLGQLKIEVAPSASRCIIHLQDEEDSCSAYRLEF